MKKVAALVVLSTLAGLSAPAYSGGWGQAILDAGQQQQGARDAERQQLEIERLRLENERMRADPNYRPEPLPADQPTQQQFGVQQNPVTQCTRMYSSLDCTTTYPDGRVAIQHCTVMNGQMDCQ